MNKIIIKIQNKIPKREIFKFKVSNLMTLLKIQYIQPFDCILKLLIIYTYYIMYINLIPTTYIVHTSYIAAYINNIQINYAKCPNTNQRDMQFKILVIPIYLL